MGSKHEFAARLANACFARMGQFRCPKRSIHVATKAFRLLQETSRIAIHVRTQASDGKFAIQVEAEILWKNTALMPITRPRRSGRPIRGPGPYFASSYTARRKRFVEKSLTKIATC